jgi:putative peptidoglycan lipid II flippase
MTQSKSSGGGSNQAQVIQAAFIVGIAFVISRLLGLVRDALINYYFGIATNEANAYFIASRFPETIFYIIAGGALGSAFIPTFAAYFVRKNAAGGWRLFSIIVNLVIIVTTIIAGLTAILAPQILTLFYADLIAGDAALKKMTVDLMRIMLVSPIIFGISGVVMGALNARQHFLLPAIAPIIYNTGIIIGAVLLAPNVMGLAFGMVAGSLGHLLIQLPGLRQKKARFTATISLRDTGVRQVLRLMAPRVLGLSFGQLNFLLIQFLAQAMAMGSIPALGNAWRIMIMPQGIIGQALGIAAFPTFSTLAAQSALAEMRRILGSTLRLIAFLGLPAAALLMVLRRPIVAVLFQRGEFGPEATDFVSWALLFYALSLVGLAAIEIISRAFYALEDTRTPVLAGGLQLAVMWLLGLWFGDHIFPRLNWLPLGGLALGYSVSTFLELALLLWLLSKKLGGVGDHTMLDGVWRMIGASLGLVAASALTLQAFSEIGPMAQLIIGGLAGATVYLCIALLLGVAELRQMVEMVRRRIKRPAN